MTNYHIPDVDASELQGDTSELIPTALPKGKYGRSGFQKPPLRQERPKAETVKTNGSWWIGLTREQLAQEVAKRQPEMSSSKEAWKVSSNTYAGATMLGDR